MRKDFFSMTTSEPMSRTKIMPVFLTLAVALLIAFMPGRAQEFQYQFRDTPRPEADVVVVRHSLRPGPGSDFYIIGRLFNRGLKVANNVRIIVTVTSKEGVHYPMNPIQLNPSDIPATSFADFEGRLTSVTDPRDLFVQVRAEWNQ
jgi:hypothetical protein